MKKFILMVMMTVMSVGMAVAANPVEATARKAAEVMLNEAVKAGYGTAADKDALLKSGIVEEVTKTLVSTNFDFAAAVDKAAEVAVREGWCKDKKSAKKVLRQACEKARKDASLVQKIYNFLGI